MTGIESPAFEGWAIAAAYQYLVDHGYEPDTFVGPVGEKGYRLGGIDRKISGAFGCADHGSRSTVMTVAEKYVWCARNEICGYMADRVPVFTSAWRNGSSQDTYELAADYNDLLSYQSPLFEATVNRLSAERTGDTPSYPTAFSCDDGDTICTERELGDWIGSGNADVPIALLNHKPNVNTSIADDVIPVAPYASDWGICGKQARCWAYCGVMDTAELAKLAESGTVAIDGYDHASAFAAGINVEATYISPVEYMSAPWIKEYDEEHERDKIADVHVAASPLTGSGVDSLTDIGDCWYRFPSKLAMDLCGITHTPTDCATSILTAMPYSRTWNMASRIGSTIRHYLPTRTCSSKPFAPTTCTLFGTRLSRGTATGSQRNASRKPKRGLNYPGWSGLTKTGNIIRAACPMNIRCQSAYMSLRDSSRNC